jgi:integrase
MQISQAWVAELPGISPRVEKLKRLRARALVSLLADSGLRVSDIIRLTKDWRYTKIDPTGSVAVDTVKSGTKAQCHFSDQTLFFVDEYLDFRNDSSPWLFIQHGKHGTNTATNQADYARESSNSNDLRRGYGVPITSLTVWRIIRTVADLAGYDRKKGTDYVSTHAVRHWLAQYMRDNDVPLIQIQEALGHSSLEITRAIYAPHSTQRMAIKCIDNLHSTSEKSPA